MSFGFLKKSHEFNDFSPPPETKKKKKSTLQSRSKCALAFSGFGAVGQLRARGRGATTARVAKESVTEALVLSSL